MWHPAARVKRELEVKEEKAAKMGARGFSAAQLEVMTCLARGMAEAEENVFYLNCPAPDKTWWHRARARCVCEFI